MVVQAVCSKLVAKIKMYDKKNVCDVTVVNVDCCEFAVNAKKWIL